MICFNLCFLAWLGIHHTSPLVTLRIKTKVRAAFTATVSRLQCFLLFSSYDPLKPSWYQLSHNNLSTWSSFSMDSPWVLMHRWCPQPPEAYLSRYSVDTQHKVSLLPWMNSRGDQRSALSLCLQMKALEVRGHVTCPRCVTDKSQTYTQGQLPVEAASCF